jgi:hypothetical protein
MSRCSYTLCEERNSGQRKTELANQNASHWTTSYSTTAVHSVILAIRQLILSATALTPPALYRASPLVAACRRSSPPDVARCRPSHVAARGRLGAPMAARGCPSLLVVPRHFCRCLSPPVAARGFPWPPVVVPRRPWPLRVASRRTSPPVAARCRPSPPVAARRCPSSLVAAHRPEGWWV